jgi:hypothetical protein
MATLKEEYEERKLRASKEEQPLSARERLLMALERLEPLLLAALVPVAGGLWAVYVYNDNQWEIAKAVDAAAQTRAKLVELQKPFIDQQFGTYKNLTQTVGELLSFTGDRAEWDKSYFKYWRQHFRPVALVEDNAVHQAKIKYAEALKAYSKEGNSNTFSDLEIASKSLTSATRNSIQSSWTTGELNTTK